MDVGPRDPRWLEHEPEGSEDVISQVAWRPSRQLLLRVTAPVVAGLSMAALLLLAFTVAGAGGAKSASPASWRIVKIGSVSVLANGQGFTVYWFAPDTATKSECNGLCTAYWPPVEGPLTAGPCLTGRLGTIKRSDGLTQATYDGHPLYTYVGDSAPGQARGGAPSLNGGPWREITNPAKPGRSVESAGCQVPGSQGARSRSQSLMAKRPMVRQVRRCHRRSRGTDRGGQGRALRAVRGWCRDHPSRSRRPLGHRIAE